MSDDKQLCQCMVDTCQGIYRFETYQRCRFKKAYSGVFVYANVTCDGPPALFKPEEFEDKFSVIRKLELPPEEEFTEGHKHVFRSNDGVTRIEMRYIDVNDGFSLKLTDPDGREIMLLSTSHMVKKLMRWLRDEVDEWEMSDV